MISLEKFTALCFLGFLLWLLVRGIIYENSELLEVGGGKNEKQRPSH